MSRTLVYRTNQEFDKCAELLRNILTVQGNRTVYSWFLSEDERVSIHCRIPSEFEIIADAGNPPKASRIVSNEHSSEKTNDKTNGDETFAHQAESVH